MQAFYERPLDDNYYMDDFRCQDLNTDDISCSTLTASGNIECNGITASGILTVGGLFTANGGVTLGADDKLTLPSSYTTAPTISQLGGVTSAKNSATYTVPSQSTWSAITLTGTLNTSTTPNTYYTYITLSPGTYVLTGSFSFSAAPVGLTFAGIAISSSSSSLNSEGALASSTSSLAAQQWSVSRIVSLTASTNFYLLIYTTGATPSIAANGATLSAVRIA